MRVGDGLVMPGPFAPRTMRIHPLTHAELDARSEARIVLYVELKDAWGDTVKGVGRVQAQLWPKGQTSENATRWDIDLRSLEANADFHDPATRAYRIVLADLPAWLEDAVRSDAPNQNEAHLRVLFLTTQTGGQPAVLRDEFDITP